MIRVLLVDDQALVRAGFRMILDAAEGIEVVGEASNGEDAIAAVRRLQPDADFDRQSLEISISARFHPAGIIGDARGMRMLGRL